MYDLKPSVTSVCKSLGKGLSHIPEKWDLQNANLGVHLLNGWSKIRIPIPGLQKYRFS